MADVWYAAYGSNLARDRFLLYLRGGRPRPGQRHHPGARDPSDPVADRRATVPGSMLFAGRSLRWSGGTSVLHPEAPDRAVVRLWAVTAEQAADVQAQECALEPGRIGFDVGEVVRRRSVVVCGRRYGRVVALGERDGLPVITFTSPRPQVPAAPGADYLEMVRRGLVDSGLDGAAADRYLASRPGLRR